LDRKTLQGLELAYSNAPSAELAKIIVLALIQAGELSSILKYIEAIELPLEEADALSIGDCLVDIDEAKLALNYLTMDNSNQALLISKCYLKLNENEKARNAYLRAIKNNPSLREDQLDQKFELENEFDEKPKLRVVEKTDFDKVTDLTRFRSESTTFRDVVGLDDIKKQINKKIILPFQKPSLFQRFKKKIGGGVLLFGPPGCGKTLLARAAAGECNAAFYNIEISDVLDMYIGESEQKLHAIFEKARSETPCVLFFDELEALAGKRENSRNNTSANVVSQFLSELDGFSQNNHGVLVLASTNVPWAIDSAFLRPGRFDRMFFVPPPDAAARQAILEHHIHGRPHASDINFATIAKKAKGYSGADLFNLVEMASDEAIDESIEMNQDTEINQRHFKIATEQANATTIEWLTTARNYARYANDGGRYNDVITFLKRHGN